MCVSRLEASIYVDDINIMSIFTFEFLIFISAKFCSKMIRSSDVQDVLYIITTILMRPVS